MSQPRIPILDLTPEIELLWDELNAAFQRVMRSGQFIMGPEVTAFENEVAEYLGVKHAIGVNSGTDALVIALRALGVGDGDEVITTPFSFFATAESISNVGATPVFVDVDETTFDIDPELIEVVVHPESMIHALVGFRDGALMAHVGPPDMRHAIGFALHHPQRQELPVERLDLVKLGQFTFRAACETRWPALRLAREVMRTGGLSGAVFNAAKERALDAFIEKRIGFTRMAAVVEETLNRVSGEGSLIHAGITLDNVREADHFARVTADEIMKQQ